LCHRLAAAVTDVGKIEFVDLPVPKFHDYECLVKMTTGPPPSRRESLSSTMAWGILRELRYQPTLKLKVHVLQILVSRR